MTEEFKPFDPLEEITGTIPTDIHKVIIYNGPQNLDNRLSSPYNKVGARWEVKK